MQDGEITIVIGVTLSCRQLERSMLSRQPQMEAAGRRSTLIGVTELQLPSTRPAGQPTLSPSTPRHSAPPVPLQVSRTLSGHQVSCRNTEGKVPFVGTRALGC